MIQKKSLVRMTARLGMMSLCGMFAFALLISSPSVEAGTGVVAPSCNLNAGTSPINAGQNTKLNWNINYGTSKMGYVTTSIDQGIGTVNGPIGTAEISPIQTTTYTLTVNFPVNQSITCSSTVNVINDADLAITNAYSTPATVTRGQNVTVTIEYKNNGPATAYTVVLKDEFREGVLTPDAKSLPSNCEITNVDNDPRLQVECNLGNLTSGQTGSISYVASTANASLPLVKSSVSSLAPINTNLIHIASDAATAHDTNPDNNDATIGISILLDVVNQGDIRINEIMWAGSSAGANDEWIELRNTSSFNVDISGYTLTSLLGGIESIVAIIPSNTILEGKEHYLISKLNTTSSSIDASNTPNLIAPALDLPDTNLQLKLRKPDATLIDVADDGVGVPLAGSNGATKLSMSRKWTGTDGTLASNWFTSFESYGFDVGATDMGTPGVGNFLNLMVLAKSSGGVSTMVMNIFGEAISQFEMFKASSTTGVNISLGDVDGDGSQEIVASKNGGGSNVVQTEFNGERLFYNNRDNFEASSNSDGVNIAACDFDGDGAKDDIVAGKKTNGNQVIIFDKDGTRISFFEAFTSGSIVNVACGDVDGDNVDEIVVGKGNGGNQVLVFEANGTRTAVFNAFNSGSGVNVSTGNMDGDAADEIIVGKETGGNQVLIFEGNGTQKASFNGFTTGSGVRVSSLDVDNDGVDEVLITKGTGGTEVTIRKANGTLVTTFNSFVSSSGVNIAGGKMILK